ncbi:TPA: hypothetical protein VCA04_001853 [Streptococcus suis]|uniref:competence regulator inhibitor paratox n=1 Tax=Streptococcus suis TaxID=1307 RepID=UPI0005CD41E7|nr:hypothetical protein [Streptococcus suis]MCK4041553.1 hypothetical protein [Streptococcus suis]MDG3326887.1 hypothetical protein [Streptococcus suis]MDW8705109.1 hypothetical protein [Streptococcus suis]NQS07356.1 hypothetical protein [Streptococcus suis]NRG80200.1 hypothetical protein [Streptococcus suis]
MSETQAIFIEALENNWLSDTITVVRKNGKIYDFVLTGEQILDYEVVSKESLALVLEELNLTKFHNREYIP